MPGSILRSAGAVLLSLVVALLLVIAVFYNMYLLPYPLWFMVLDFVSLPLCIYYGTKFGAARSSA